MAEPLEIEASSSLALVDNDPRVTSMGCDGEMTFLIGIPCAMFTSTVIEIPLESISAEVS